MTLRHDFSLETSLPPDLVFAYLSDFSHQPDWRHDVVTSELRSGAPGQPGSTWDQEIKPGRLPRPHRRVVELHEVVAPSTLSYRTIDDALLRAAGTYRIEASGGGTKVVVSSTLDAARPAGAAALLAIGGHVNSTVKRYRTQLKAALDHLDGPTPGLSDVS
jgi:uncharacterized protein YndB with AHSA1/START domain